MLVSLDIKAPQHHLNPRPLLAVAHYRKIAAAYDSISPKRHGRHEKQCRTEELQLINMAGNWNISFTFMPHFYLNQSNNYEKALPNLVPTICSRPVFLWGQL